MTSYTGTSGWSWGATWTGGDDANEDEEDAEEYHVSVYSYCRVLLTTCLGLRYWKRLFVAISGLFVWNV